MVFDPISTDGPIIWTAKWEEDQLIVEEKGPMNCGVSSLKSPWAVVNPSPEEVRPVFFPSACSNLLNSSRGLLSDLFLCWSHAGQTLLSGIPGQVVLCC